MKKFLLQLIFFMLPIIISWLLIELLYRDIPNNYSIKHRGVSFNSNTEVIILGNSHSFYGLNPDYLSKSAYNLSNISQGLQIDEVLLYKHLEKFKKLKTVIFTVDYFTLSQNDGFPLNRGENTFTRHRWIWKPGSYQISI